MAFDEKGYIEKLVWAYVEDFGISAEGLRGNADDVGLTPEEFLDRIIQALKEKVL